MKALVLGCRGQLGQALADTAMDGVTIVGLDLPELDITDANALLAICRDLKPAIIINAAAYTAVDQAESDEALATAVNSNGPKNVAVAALAVGARLIHVSTDFVFDGKASVPYAVDAPTNPLSVYGRTKREGELAVLANCPDSAAVVRTSWLYSKTGKNFVKTMLSLMQSRDELSVVSDQFGSPTWAESLAVAVWALADAPDCCGVFHWTDVGKTSWHEFAVAIQEEALALGLLQAAIPIHAIRTEDYPTPAARPAYSVLDCTGTSAALGLQPIPWRENLRQMLKGIET